MINILIFLACLQLLLVAWLAWRTLKSSAETKLLQSLDEKHRAMLLDLNDGLNKLGDRMNTGSQADAEKMARYVLSLDGEKEH